jgi:CMP-N-acetylneuraminic acid synthetase
MDEKIVALVPIRHNSERIKEKNFREFNGKPLFHWILATLDSCDAIPAIYLDTNSPVIKEQAPELSEKIRLIDRPDELCGDDISMNDVLFYDVSTITSDYFLQTHVTNPLLTRGTIERAIGEFFDSREHDSLFSVTKLQSRLWNVEGVPLNHDPGLLLQTQDLPPVYEENSNIYIFSRELMLQTKNRLGQNPLMFPVCREEAFDIDEEIDFLTAEVLHSTKQDQKTKRL